MWNKTTLFLWISVSVKKAGRRGFSLRLLLPLFLLLQWIDIAEDVLKIYRLFSREKQERKYDAGDICSFETGITTAKALVSQLLFKTGRTDLADIDIKNEKEQIRVKCVLW